MHNLIGYFHFPEKTIVLDQNIFLRIHPVIGWNNFSCENEFLRNKIIYFLFFIFFIIFYFIFIYLFFSSIIQNKDNNRLFFLIFQHFFNLRLMELRSRKRDERSSLSTDIHAKRHHGAEPSILNQDDDETSEEELSPSSPEDDQDEEDAQDLLQSVQLSSQPSVMVPVMDENSQLFLRSIGLSDSSIHNLCRNGVTSLELLCGVSD